ncbi:TPA: hypothetical protein N0F65_009530 [Lagenidium giganteum]|uniref:ABC transporter n=1 Tax=Lagenidium giganteum TaxID=4803 RepID=A0AAV2YZ43_9STRA|nr:TPA: hypothetical protein N0F65_009530 [Lagenidium giganteum]
MPRSHARLARIRGISGGERKRLSFATEVLTNPSLLFVDEPTSGLDSLMAKSVVAQLQQMARDGRTVIATIHQPSSGIFALFDVLYLLVDGCAVYHGRATDAVAYFAGLGLQCPSFVNPSDFFVKQLVIMDHGVARIERLKQEWKKQQTTLLRSDEEVGSYRGCLLGDSLATTPIEDTRLGVFQQTQLLCARNLVRTVRNKIGFRVLIFQALFISIIVGLVYLQLDVDQKGIQNFAGVLFFIVANQTFIAANPTFIAVPIELPITEREFKAGLYRLGSWYLAKNISELPLQILQPVTYFVPAYFMVGFGGGFLVWFYMQNIVILAYSAAIGLGYMVSCLARRVDLAPIVGVIILLPFLLFAGLFLNSADSPVYLVCLEYLSPMKFGYAAIMKVFWHHIKTIPCDSAVENCVALTGAEVLRNFGMESHSALEDGLLLLLINVCFRFAGFLFLWWHFRSRK